MLLKKFLMALAIALYSVVPVVAGDNDRGHLKKAHLGAHGRQHGTFDLRKNGGGLWFRAAPARRA